MKYYSEVTNKVYDTPEKLEAAEQKVLEAKKEKEALKAKREERAKEVEKAFEAVQEAQKAADKLLSDFCKDYGSFHMTTKGETPFFKNSLFDFMLRGF